MSMSIDLRGAPVAQGLVLSNPILLVDNFASPDEHKQNIKPGGPDVDLFNQAVGLVMQCLGKKLWPDVAWL